MNHIEIRAKGYIDTISSCIKDIVHARIDSELIYSRLLKAFQFYTPDPQTYYSNKYLSNQKKRKEKK